MPDDRWKLYDDARLDTLIRSAIAANTDLRAAAANLERSHALLEEARTLREPSVMLNAGLEYGQSAGEQYLQRVTPPLSWDYDTGLTVGYDLDLFGGIKPGIEAASAEDNAVAAAHDLILVNVVAGTARAYSLACGAGLELVSAQRSLDLQRQSLALTERLMSAGRANDLDVTRQRQLAKQLEEVIPSLEGAQKNALLQLAVLTGRAPAQYDVDLEACSAPPRLFSPLAVGDGTALLKRRPGEGSAMASRDQARRAADEAQRLELGGRANELAVLDAQRTLASAELSLAQVQAAISDDQIAILLSLGGGWQSGASGPKLAEDPH